MSNTHAMRGAHARAYSIPSNVTSLADLRPLLETAPDRVGTLPGEYLIRCAAFGELLAEYARKTLHHTANCAFDALDREEEPTPQSSEAFAATVSLCAVILDECERVRDQIDCANRQEGGRHE